METGTPTSLRQQLGYGMIILVVENRAVYGRAVGLTGTVNNMR